MQRAHGRVMTDNIARQKKRQVAPRVNQVYSRVSYDVKLDLVESHRQTN